MLFSGSFRASRDMVVVGMWRQAKMPGALISTCTAVFADALFIDIEAKSHRPAGDVEHRNFELQNPHIPCRFVKEHSFHQRGKGAHARDQQFPGSLAVAGGPS